MSDKLEFLGGDEPSEAEVVAAAPAPEPVMEAQAAPVAPPPPEPGHIPITALLEEREKRQAEAARARAAESQLDALRRAAEEPYDPAPEAQLQAAIYANNLRVSRRFAERDYGKDTVEQVHQWAFERCDADPYFNQQMRASEDPYEAAYQAWNRDRIAAEVTPGALAEFKAWKAALAAASAHPNPKPAHGVPRTPAPRSLATASGTGGAGAPHVPIGPGQAFSGAITR